MLMYREYNDKDIHLYLYKPISDEYSSVKENNL